MARHPRDNSTSCSSRIARVFLKKNHLDNYLPQFVTDTALYIVNSSRKFSEEALLPSGTSGNVS